MKIIITGLLIMMLVGFCLAFSSGSPADVSLQQTRALIKKVIDATNNREPNMLKECYSPIFVYHDQSAPAGAAADMVSIYNASIISTPDLKATVEDIIAEKDKVAVRMIFQGTNTKYNKKFRMAIHWIARIEKGKIVEVWNVSDIQGALEQIGFRTVPPDVNEAKIQTK